MAKSYDAIVVGARCAGAPTAMLLARQGYNVLLVDRATFPSDTLSTHMVHPPGIAALDRWGLLGRLQASGCPPITDYSFDFGHFTIAGNPRPSGTTRVAYAPRRTVLDKLLVDAATEAGVEVREGFAVEEVVIEKGRARGIRGHSSGMASAFEGAPIVIGADGHHSLVAKSVGVGRYREQPSLEALYFSYWDGLPVDGFEVFVRPRRSWAAFPTHDGLTLLVVGWPYDEFRANRTDVEGNYLKSLELAPEFAQRVAGATRVSRIRGTADVPNYFRKPYGPGWGLVGDAGYHKDPCTAQGISDAFRDAELLSEAVDQTFSGRLSFEQAMGAYQEVRDRTVTAMYDLTCQLAAMEPPPPETQQLLAAVSRNQDSMDDFVSMIAGTVSPAEFFSPPNVERVFHAASAVAAS
jgi:flavin-dependent dehydrogenase